MTNHVSSILTTFQSTPALTAEIDKKLLDKDPEGQFRDLARHLWNNPLDKLFNKALKRGFDISFSVIVIICIVSWLLPLLALMIKLSSRGPIFFKQLRTGMNNKNFICWKLRSMYINDEADNLQASLNDTRVTLVGKFLRKFSLDELPQFYSVLIGNMSVVGPRPHMLNHTELYSKLIDNYMARHFIRPGITGLSQVEGYRGLIHNHQVLKNRIKFDLIYLKRWSFLLDMKIILKTVKLVLLGDSNAF
jgi:lipopolysaccharide/colanic/teichoic acid biosynthesis glycosyltransferase